ncbi:MAG TPA: stage II sporulation protein E, partial [Turneriella sp.]|nr:stage II sporulation protein E [Turneriella sp.]
MLSRLKEFFRPNLERKKYKKEFSDELNQQLAGWARVGALIGTVAWLDFAFHTDKQLHPEFPELLYFRLGLSVLASLVLVLSFIPFTKKYNAASLKVMVTYVILATSWFTGRIANDPNYVSGLQIVVMIPIAAPVAYWQFLSMQIASVIVFFISVFIYKPNLSTAATAYSMNNLIISYAIAIAFGFLLDRIRFDSFLKAKNIQIKNAEIEAQIKRVNDLKNQQDGDYFLTAQLLQPLSLNEVTPSRVYIDFLTEQKKKFQFRKWSSEIGGDISSAHSIQLRGKTYVVFINGDVMGKLIQGAGGA